MAGRRCSDRSDHAGPRGTVEVGTPAPPRYVAPGENMGTDFAICVNITRSWLDNRMPAGMTVSVYETHPHLKDVRLMLGSASNWLETGLEVNLAMYGRPAVKYRPVFEKLQSILTHLVSTKAIEKSTIRRYLAEWAPNWDVTMR